VREVTLPESITEIPTACFYDCRNLRNIVLPASVTYVAEDAFYYCRNITIWATEAIPYVSGFDDKGRCVLLTNKLSLWEKTNDNKETKL